VDTLNRFSLFSMALMAFFLLFTAPVRGQAKEDKITEEVVSLEDVVVTERRSADFPETPPDKTAIHFETYKSAAPVHSVVDVLKDSALVDFRGKSDQDLRSERGESPILLRGFDVRRYINAVDGVTFDQPLHFGQVVDYDLVSLDQIESVEIIPGAHSARYSGKSLGGVINFKTKAPEEKESARPGGTVASSYGSYGTWDNRAAIEGGLGRFNYGASVQNFSTDGYLRHGASEKDVFGWALGYAFASGGYLKYMGNMVKKERESFAKNDPAGDFDSSYPVVTSPTAGDIAADSKTHFETWVHRLSFVKPTDLGTVSLGISYADKTDHYFTEIRNGAHITNPNSRGKNLALVLQNEVELFEKHTLVFGLDTLDYWVSFDPREDDDNRTRSHRSAFIEDTWQVTPGLSLQAGLRYERVDLSINNYSADMGWGSYPGYQVTLDPPQRYIEKDFEGWMPKFFATYALDEHAASLRDTSVSLGVSRFWNVAPYCLV
jgi:outer membrane receptor protein involved in Fe transport